MSDIVLSIIQMYSHEWIIASGNAVFYLKQSEQNEWKVTQVYELEKKNGMIEMCYFENDRLVVIAGKELVIYVLKEEGFEFYASGYGMG